MTEFLAPFAQLVLSSAVGVLLFFAWRNVAGARGPIYWMITLGLLGRALAGQLLFWVSYLALPPARPLQAGNGFWFFATDGIYYFDRAIEAARGGVDAILFLNRTEPSVFYIQTLAAFAFFFGASPAVALLLNVASFLGICTIVLKLAPPAATRSRIAAIAAVSLSPSAVLWSLQPLKDVYFVFLVVLFVFACHLWQRLAAQQDGSLGRRRLGVAALMALTLYAVAGIRWYFAMALVAATALFLLLTAARGRQRLVLATSSFVMILVLLTAFRTGGGPYIPDPIRRAVTLNSETVAYAAESPKMVMELVERSRRSFEAAAGATSIGAGEALKTETQPKTDTAPPAAPPPAAVATATTATPTPPPAAQPAETPQIAAKKEPVRKKARARKEPAPAAAKVASAEPAATPAPAAATPPATAPAPASPTPNPATAAATPAPAAPAPVPVAASTPAPAPKPAARTAEEPTDPAQTITLPRSPVARFLSGLAAVVLPKTVAEALGIFRVGGGRGLWLFVEIDTLVFDAILLYALYSIITTFRTAVRTPSFWLVLAAVVLVAVPLIYTVSNFGTLFRHRTMLYIGLILLPLTVAVARNAPVPPAPQSATGE